MPIPEKGKTREEIFSYLDGLKSRDVDWKSGKVFAYIYNLKEDVDEVMNRAYISYLTESGIDPMSFPSMMELEKDVVGFVRDLVRGDENTVGNFTSGGTESIFCAMKAYRDWARANRPEITHPEVIVPQTAHPSFHSLPFVA